MDSPPSAAAMLVLRWLTAVFNQSDLATAWPLTDEPFRLATAQSWIMLEADRPQISSLDRDQLAGRLSLPEQPADPLWSEFAGWRVIRWREVLPDFVTDAGLRGLVSGEYLTALDIEQVWITHTDTKIAKGLPVEAQRFLVRHVDRQWKVAGIGGVLPIPGWPPRETDRL